MNQVRTAAVVAALALIAACGAASSSARADGAPQPAGQRPSVSDPDDFYYYEGKPVQLDRATSEFVLGVATETDLTSLLSVSAGAATAGEPIVVRGRRFVVVKVEPPRPQAMEQLMDAMRARSDVWFASPIYYQPASRARVVPTDEVLIKPKPSTTAAALANLLKQMGLRRVATVDGTTDQYVVRLEPAKRAAMLRVSRELFDSGLFQWAEPDFIQEYRRQG